MKQLALPLLLLSIISACGDSDTTGKINKGGEMVGQTVGEFVSGVGSGVNKALDVKIELPEALKEKGIELGKITIADAAEGEDNLLSVYFIFQKDFNGDLTMKAFDGKNLEMGRSKIHVSGKKDEAAFFDFTFDKRTNIDNDSRITLE